MKTDAEIYKDALKRRWPYVDEPRPQRRPGRPDAGMAIAVQPPKPKPLAPVGAAERTTP